ncbi:MT-A70-domain-containing protein [Aspergillus varians]
MTSDSSILYQNDYATVFLIDIPTSITLAQELSPQSHPDVPSDAPTSPSSSISREPHKRKRRHILSSPALKTPYPASFEPKSKAARAKVLARIPQFETHEEIAPLVSEALDEIRKNYSQEAEWYLPRHLLEEEEKDDDDDNDGLVIKDSEPKKGLSAWAYGIRRGKREIGKKRRADETVVQKNDHDEEDDKFNPEYFALAADDQIQPPLVLSPGRNRVEDEAELCNNVVKNTSLEAAFIEIRSIFSVKALEGFSVDTERQRRARVFIIPPLSKFIICDLPISAPLAGVEYMNPIPRLDLENKFNLIVLDPPWSNKSVRRSGHYQTQTYLDSEMLTTYICSILTIHSYLPLQNEVQSSEDQSNLSIAAIWITNSVKARDAAYDSLKGAGFSICEEWIWVKTAVDGQPVTPVDGVWRKPYEILVVGKRNPGSKDGAGDGGILRRVIAAVPDVHSRKPNFKEVFERVFFKSQSGAAGVRYSALEVFARNLTAGWWACGNEVLKFNSESWWIGD